MLPKKIISKANENHEKEACGRGFNLEKNIIR
jgi:hypothetical protein